MELCMSAYAPDVADEYQPCTKLPSVIDVYKNLIVPAITLIVNRG